MPKSLRDYHHDIYVKPTTCEQDSKRRAEADALVEAAVKELSIIEGLKILAVDNRKGKIKIRETEIGALLKVASLKSIEWVNGASEEISRF